MAEDMKNGLITKEIVTITDMTAANRWTRDVFEKKI